MILVKSVLILILIVTCGLQRVAASATDIAAMLTTFAKTGQEYQNQSKQFEQQRKEQQSKLNEINAVTNKQTAMADMTSPYGTGATPPVAAAGYPLTDPYTNPQYWSQRGQQFKFSMDVAAKRSDAMNNMAKIQLEQEKQKQKMMMEGVGTLMKSAGGLMGQMAADKKAEELKIASDLEAEQKAAEENQKTGDSLQVNFDKAKKAYNDNAEIIKEGMEKGDLNDAEKIQYNNAIQQQRGLKDTLDKTESALNKWHNDNKSEDSTITKNEKTDEATITSKPVATKANDEVVETKPEVAIDESEPASNSEQDSSAEEAIGE